MNTTATNDAINHELAQSMLGVLGDMQETMAAEVSSIRLQSDQVKSLLIDAVGTLHDSFSAIHTVSDEQMKSMTSLMMEVVGAEKEENIFQQAEHAGAVLTTLVETLLLSSKNNLRALTSMDVVQKRMHEMKRMSEQQEKLGEQLHECIEADTLDMEQLRALSQDLREAQQKQVDYSRDALLESTKTHHLIDVIASNDMQGVYQSKEQVEEILKHFFDINEMVTLARVQVNKLNTEQRNNLGSAIRALQFEDISTQSLEHTDRHLDRMQGMLDILSDGMKNLNQADIETADYVQQLAVIHAAMLAYHQRLQLEHSNPVSQESMDEGDIDLF